MLMQIEHQLQWITRCSGIIPYENDALFFAGKEWAPNLHCQIHENVFDIQAEA